MRRISKLRFDALAGYARLPMAQIMAEELGWFELQGSLVVGAVIRDREDNDYGGLVFAPDAKHRYRWVGLSNAAFVSLAISRLPSDEGIKVVQVIPDRLPCFMVLRTSALGSESP